MRCLSRYDNDCELVQKKWNGVENELHWPTALGWTQPPLQCINSSLASSFVLPLRYSVPTLLHYKVSALLYCSLRFPNGALPLGETQPADGDIL